MSTLIPLTPARLNTPMSSPLKRKADASPEGPSIKAKRVTAYPSLGADSDDEADDLEHATTAPKLLYDFNSDKGVFKVPAMPSRTRLATPATSTVAASSSPQRGLTSSEIDTPGRPQPEVIANINLVEGELIVFGRHHAAWNASEPVQMPSGKAAEVHLDASLPRRAFNLPRTAKLASRCHAVVQVPCNGEVEGKYRLVVLGQNGLRVRMGDSEKYKRMRAGQRRDLTVECEIDFHGCAIRLSLPIGHRSNAVSSPSGAERALGGSLSPPPSLPSSSPPMMPMGLSLDDEEVDHTARVSDRHASPLFDSEKSSVPLFPTTSHSETGTHKQEEVAEEEAELAEPIPEDVDLPAILANTVVFSGSSKLSLPDLVRHMLEVSLISHTTSHVTDS